TKPRVDIVGWSRKGVEAQPLQDVERGLFIDRALRYPGGVADQRYGLAQQSRIQNGWTQRALDMGFESDVLGDHFSENKKSSLMVELADHRAGIAPKVLTDDERLNADRNQILHHMEVTVEAFAKDGATGGVVAVLRVNISPNPI